MNPNYCNKVVKIVIVTQNNEFTFTDFKNYPFKQPVILIKNLKTQQTKPFISREFNPTWILVNFSLAVDVGCYEEDKIDIHDFNIQLQYSIENTLINHRLMQLM